MKQGKRLTRAMKVLLSEKGLNPDNWLYVKNTPVELVVLHRHSDKSRAIKKGSKESQT